MVNESVWGSNLLGIDKADTQLLDGSKKVERKRDVFEFGAVER